MTQRTAIDVTCRESTWCSQTSGIEMVELGRTVKLTQKPQAPINIQDLDLLQYAGHCLAKKELSQDTIHRLRATSAYRRFDEHYRTEGFKYFPSFTIAIVGHHSNGRDRYFTSTPVKKDDGKTIEGDHAEELTIYEYTKHNEIDDIKSIRLTSSPCPACTIGLTLAFENVINKPVIKFLYFHGNEGTKARTHALNSFKRLWKDGFIVERWTIDDYIEYLPENQRLLSDDWVKWRDQLEISRQEYHTKIEQQISTANSKSLRASSACSRFDRNEGFKFFPSFTIAIVGHHSNGRDRHFTSTPVKKDNGTTIEGDHAEEILLDEYTKHEEIYDIISIRLTCSPCPDCTIGVISAFDLISLISNFYISMATKEQRNVKVF